VSDGSSVERDCRFQTRKLSSSRELEILRSIKIEHGLERKRRYGIFEEGSDVGGLEEITTVRVLVMSDKRDNENLGLFCGRTDRSST
jgi:hypothetical protein